jgi:hypothetical protein
MYQNLTYSDLFISSLQLTIKTNNSLYGWMESSARMQQEECFSQCYKFLLDRDFGVNVPNSSFSE